MNVIPLGPGAGTEVVRALKANHVGLPAVRPRPRRAAASRSSSSGNGPRCRPGRPPSPSAPAPPCCPSPCTTTAGYHRGDVLRRGAGRAAGPAQGRRRPGHPGPGPPLEELISAAPRPVAPAPAELAVGPGRAERRPGPAMGVGRSRSEGLTCASGCCPYSLSVPGGVQGQVLGLARSLRRHGPRRPGARPLRRSAARRRRDAGGPQHPDLGQRLGRPARSGPVGHAPHRRRAPRRAVRRRPRPRAARARTLAHDALVVKPAPLVATFHAAGGAPAYRWLGPAAAAAGRPHRPTRRRCPTTPGGSPSRHIGGEYTVLFNGIEIDRFAKAEPWPRPSADGRTILFVGRHEPRKGLGCPARRHGPTAGRRRQLWVAGHGPETDALRPGTAGDPRIEWLGRIDDDEKAARLRAADVFCAPSLTGRVVRRRAARGDGRRDARRGQRPPRLPQRRPRPAPTPCSSSRAMPMRWPPALRRVLDDDADGRAAGGVRAGNGPPPSPWTAWPSATSPCTAVTPPAEPRSVSSRDPNGWRRTS